LSCVSFADSNNGTVVGANGTILRTTNGGSTWTLQQSGSTDDLLGVSFTDTNNGTVVGRNGTILRTTNGGIMWIPQMSDTIYDFYGVSYIDENIGTVVGGHLFSQNIILRTTNGGET